MERASKGRKDGSRDKMFLRNGASCVCWRRSFSMYYIRTVSTLLFSGCESERRSLGYTGPTYMYFGTLARIFCGQQQTTPAILIHPIYGHLGGSGGKKMQQSAVQVSLLFAGSPCSAPERPKLFTPLTSRGLASKMVGRGFLEREESDMGDGQMSPSTDPNT